MLAIRTTTKSPIVYGLGRAPFESNGFLSSFCLCAIRLEASAHNCEKSRGVVEDNWSVMGRILAVTAR
jgi:hypothetical protein